MDTTLYAEQGPDELRASRPANLVVRFEQTCARERTLRVNHWEFPDFGLFCVRFTLHADPGLSFCGMLSRLASCVDFRIYLPRLLQDYENRGGRVVLRTTDAPTVVRLSADHDLMVVATGGRAMADLFPRDPGRSPYTSPQRQMCAGVYLGMTHSDPMGLDFELIPGVGEIFRLPFYSFGGRISAMNIEAVPGGPLDFLAHLPYQQDPAGFTRTVLEALARYAPEIREHIDDRVFGLARPIDLIQGGITPVVRCGWTPVGDERYAIAVGDAWVRNDPVLGQGANLGSNCAFALAEAIVTATRFDEGFCRAVEQRMWGLARPVTEWSNAALQSPPPHMTELWTAAAADQCVADALIDNWNDPAAGWAAMGSPAGIASFLRRVRAPSMDG
ncbi:MAG: styrene monooxygenase/indole monooxygenase family protein [Pseudonocardiaceae bacterium]